MKERRVKVVIIEPHGRIRVFPNTDLPGDITLEEIVETARSEFGLDGEYEVYVRVKGVEQELENLRIRPREIDGIVILAEELKAKRIDFK